MLAEGKKTINIMEVCPRDGWQNIMKFIPTEQKIYLIKRMLDTGVRYLQLTSFVHPKFVPQMRDAKEVVQAIVTTYPDRFFNALVPNLFGAKAAVDCGLNEICYVISVSESHNQANIGRTHQQSFAELEKIIHTYPDLHVTMGCATTFGCPFEGEQRIDKVLAFVERGIELGVKTLELSDTIGAAYPKLIQKMILTVKKEFPHIPIMVHLHDTRNNGVLNSWIAAETGVDFIHTSLGGLGGCPFAPGASGNTSTEDLIYLFSKCGIETGIDFEKVLSVAREMKNLIDGNYSGHQINIPPRNSC